MRILKSLLAFTLLLTAANLIGQTVYTDDFVNLAGQVIQSDQLNGTRNTINVNKLPQGVYLLKINTSQGSTTQKIVKNQFKNY